MFLRFPLSVLLLSFLATSFALPERFKRSIEDGSSTKDVEEKFKDLTEEVEKTLNHLTKDLQWIYNNLVSVLEYGVAEGFETYVTWYFDLVLRMEFLTMADGSHYMFPVSGKPETEQEYKAVSIAVSKVLMNLKTMERADKVIRNVTNSVTKVITHPQFKEEGQSPEKTEKILRTFLHEFFQALDRQMETDEVLRDDYKKRVAEARVFVKQAPKMEGPLVKLWETDRIAENYKKLMTEIKEFIKDKKTLMRAIVNKLFLKTSVKHFGMIFSSAEHKRYLFARAFIQKAVDSSSSESEINDIYQKALVAVIEYIPIKGDNDSAEEELFETLEKTLKSHPVLHKEIMELVTEIDKNTVYNTDMMYVDFSLL